MKAMNDTAMAAALIENVVISVRREAGRLARCYQRPRCRSAIGHNRLVTTTDVLAALDAFDRAFAAGDADRLADRYAEDAELLLLHSVAVMGRSAIRDRWARFFSDWDTSAWLTQPRIVDVHGDRAYTVSDYTETLVPRAGERPARRIVGRVVLFLRQDDDGEWRVTLTLNSHVRPVEELPDQDAGTGRLAP
jgi:uncharacterized protein (TIGR02246 family)